MKFCPDHWAALRQKIDERGMTHLIPEGGQLAVARQKDQIMQQEVTRTNFDPLMGAHWAIFGNTMKFLENAGYDPLYLFGQPSEGRNDCPVCELNYLHRETCTNPQCGLDKERGYDWMLDVAADEQRDKARELKLIGLVS